MGCVYEMRVIALACDWCSQGISMWVTQKNEVRKWRGVGLGINTFTSLPAMHLHAHTPLFCRDQMRHRHVCGAVLIPFLVFCFCITKYARIAEATGVELHFSVSRSQRQNLLSCDIYVCVSIARDWTVSCDRYTRLVHEHCKRNCSVWMYQLVCTRVQHSLNDEKSYDHSISLLVAQGKVSGSRIVVAARRYACGHGFTIHKPYSHKYSVHLYIIHIWTRYLA